MKGLGLVVLASCSHRGVLNSIQPEVLISEAQRLMPGKVLRPYVGNRFTFAA